MVTDWDGERVPDSEEPSSFGMVFFAALVVGCIVIAVLTFVFWDDLRVLVEVAP